MPPYELTDEEKAELARVEAIHRDPNYEAAVAAQSQEAVERAAAVEAYKESLEAKTDEQVTAEYETAKAAVEAKAEVVVEEKPE